jgi:hypothetical protein
VRRESCEPVLKAVCGCLFFFYWFPESCGRRGGVFVGFLRIVDWMLCAVVSGRV